MAKRFNLADYVQPAAVSESDTLEIREIPLSKIIANGRNFYGIRDVEDLADSIQLNGQLEPLIVYRYGSSAELYRVLSGHRRLSALQKIKAETALCRVVDKPASSAREDLLIIQANAQRVKTGAELATEAQRMTEALVELKKEGADLPGRLRDIVADAMGVSSSKLARIKAIRNNLRVPGFVQAYEAGKLSEAAAYELSQLDEAAQYSALDRLIDNGVSYESADIKSVQRIKKQIERGESTAQDLAIQAEKLGMTIHDGDYSPLFAHYVRRAVPAGLYTRIRGEPKSEAVQILHDWGFAHPGHGDPSGFSWDADPAALTIKKPICKRFKWAEVWELLAMDALARSSPATMAEGAGGASSAPTEKAEPEADPADEVYMAAARLISPDWMTGDPPGPGRYLCRAKLAAFEEKEYTCEWAGSTWWVYRAPAPESFDVIGWWPLPEEVRSDG